MSQQHHTSRKGSSQPDVLARPEHPVSRKDIDPDALKVMYRLNRFGHTAYLVGGSVRDLLLGRRPKDFDIGTDATPRQIRKLFRNCYLVGRRFKLAHIKFGQTIIETSTFRREPEGLDGPIRAADHRLRPDNAFGTPAQDARRRDFTVNALFYDIRTFSIIDHVGGFKDLKEEVIRCIGDPNLRFKEDPVRMIRAVRFAAKLGFTIEEESWLAIGRHSRAILTAAPSRMMEEILRLFSVQATERAFDLLHQGGLMGEMFPEIQSFLGRDVPEKELFRTMLRTLDRVGAEGWAISPAVQLASLSYAPLRASMEETHRRGSHGVPAPMVYDFLDSIARRFQMPRKIVYQVVLLLALQKKLSSPPQTGQKPRLLRHPLFAHALTLLTIITRATGKSQDAVQAWQRLAAEVLGSEKGDVAATAQSRPRRKKGRRPRRRRGGQQVKKA